MNSKSDFERYITNYGSSLLKNGEEMEVEIIQHLPNNSTKVRFIENHFMGENLYFTGTNFYIFGEGIGYLKAPKIISQPGQTHAILYDVDNGVHLCWIEEFDINNP